MEIKQGKEQNLGDRNLSDYDPDKRIERSEYKQDVGNKNSEVKTTEQSDYDPDKRIERSDYNQDDRFQQPKVETSEKSDVKAHEQSDYNSGEKVENFEKLGGSYRELKNEGYGAYSEPPKEIHHIPAYSSYYDLDVPKEDGPAIVMDRDDHRLTASCGNSTEAKEYRAKQEDLIKNGKFDEAFQMDVDDLQSKFGDKYNLGIIQANEYSNNFREENHV